ncbi:30S ribosomal protein S16 [endosymbiont GvMRE of Glomus versiforme]|uniref:30S ribosomal protein S16 n=1 Tax=endosymbiont GvMRE of Glomus versiforme TaxID=2039283 RepID=UPI000EC44DCB|nr:30S ribosomal protein S16 [endosymbiont GvMRE of Glomus versiforme]RHZ35266.1 30S ribosomal protein S16 [endosymbiont GvMRE of Glomus versiforme]
MIKIRLIPKGKKDQRSYWIVAVDARKPRDTESFIEKLGFYCPSSPKTGEEKVNLYDKDKIKKRLSWGNQPTDTVANLLKKYLHS